LTGVVAGLLIAEVGLRILGFSYPVFYTTDGYRGIALRPNMQGWYRKEGESFVRINSNGLRDREHETKKPAGTFRIALLGDSYAEALQVPLEDSFWRVMEERLNKCAAFEGRKVEVINFGVSGYGTGQELLTLEQKVWQYEPDMVLLAVTTNNDITDNVRELKKTDEVPYFVLRDGQLELDSSFREAKSFKLRNSPINRLGAWFHDNLRFIQAIHQAHGGIKAWIASRGKKPANPANTVKAESTAVASNPTPRFEELGTDNMIYRPPVDAVWVNAWDLTEALMLRMRDEVDAKGVRFLVVTLSNGIQVFPDAKARDAFMQRVGTDTLFYPELRIKALGARGRFEVVNLAPGLQNYADEHHSFLHGFGKELGNGHWNQLGHRVAGEMLAERLCAEGGR
jgi:hypothetical protein